MYVVVLKVTQQTKSLIKIRKYNDKIKKNHRSHIRMSRIFNLFTCNFNASIYNKIPEWN